MTLHHPSSNSPNTTLHHRPFYQYTYSKSSSLSIFIPILNQSVHRQAQRLKVCSISPSPQSVLISGLILFNLFLFSRFARFLHLISHLQDSSIHGFG